MGCSYSCPDAARSYGDVNIVWSKLLYKLHSYTVGAFGMKSKRYAKFTNFEYLQLVCNLCQ